MTLAPHPRSTAADLLRWLAAWLAAIVLVQSAATAHALGLGPLHTHAAAAAAGHDHPHHHGAERHHHRADEHTDLRTVATAEPAFDAAAFALVAALAFMALQSRVFGLEPRRHVWRAAPLRAWRSTHIAPLLRPPRRG